MFKVCRSNSAHRSYSALAALIRYSVTRPPSLELSCLYPSFAADGCIFYLRVITDSLKGPCNEKEYFLSLADLGQAAFIASDIDFLRDASEAKRQRCADILRTDFLDVILKQYVASCHKRIATYVHFGLHSDVSIAAVGKACIVFAKAFRLLHSPVDYLSPFVPIPWSVVDMVYFTSIFIVRTINILYLKEYSTPSASHSLHWIFLATLHDWFSFLSSNILGKFQFDPQSYEQALAAQLLRGIFYMYVLPHTVTTSTILMPCYFSFTAYAKAEL